MALTTQQLLDLVDGKIEALVNSPQVRYREGDVEVFADDKIKQLIAIKKQLLLMPDAELETMTFDFDVTNFGEDVTDYED